MAIIRVKKTKDYTVMSNYHFREKKLSLKAKGLLSLILSLPENWDYSAEGLATLSKDGRDGVKAGLKELEKFGFLERKQMYDKAGKFSGHEYIVYEKPNTENPLTENPPTDKPPTEKPLTENPTQLNTKESSTYELSTKESNTNIDYQRIANMYNETCVSFPNLRKLSDKRKDNIKTLFKKGFEYSHFEELFKNAEASSFLKGVNDRNWSATFDWLINENNMIKVLEGNYTDKPKKPGKPQDKDINNPFLRRLREKGEI